MASCPLGWNALAASCYHLTSSRDTHAGCAESCAALSATLACVTSEPEHNFATSLALAASGSDDVWIGHYGSNASSATLAWKKCVSGELSSASFTPWAPLQPNAARSEHCISMWIEYDLLWRDAPCSNAARCLCERSTGSSTAPDVSADYLAFATAEHTFYEEQLSIARFWLACAFLLIVPALSVLFLSASGPASGPASAPASASVSESASASASSPPSLTDAEQETVITLHTAEVAARHLWTRVSGSLLKTGTVIFWCATTPYTFPYVSIDFYRAVKLYTGHLPNGILNALVPWAVALMALALRPIDADGITRACNALLSVYTAMVFFMAASIFGQPAYAGTHGLIVVWSLLLWFVVITLSLWPMTSFSCLTLSTPPRQQLHRFWFCYRSGTIFYAAFSVYCALHPWRLGHRLVFTGWDDIKVAWIIVAINCFAMGLISTAGMRGRFQLWIASRLFATRGRASKQQEASVVAALIAGLPAPDVYVAARNLFRGLPITKMPIDMMSAFDEEEGETMSEMTHIQRSSRKELRAATVPAKLGEVAAFVSYSWRGVSLYNSSTLDFDHRRNLASSLTFPTDRTLEFAWPTLASSRRRRSAVCPAAAMGKRTACVW